MSDTPASPEKLAELYTYLRYDVLRIDIVYDDDFGMGYLEDLYAADPEGNEDREIVLDDMAKRRYQAALADQWVAALSRICLRATVHVTPGCESSTTFTRESPVEASKDEIWAAIDDLNDEWAADLYSNAYDAILDELRSRRLSGRSASKRRSAYRRHR